MKILTLVAACGALLLGACTTNLSAPSEPAVDTTPPATPATISPADGAVLGYFPRTVSLVWSAVSDPSGVTYRVDVQANGGGWFGLPTRCPGAITGQMCSFDFVGAQPGRWRVAAVDGAGNVSAYSAWSYFEFTR